MINYGLDEEQEEVIKWALRNIDRTIDTIYYNMNVRKNRIEDKRITPALKEIYEKQQVTSEGRLALMKKRKRIFQEMIGVTEK